MKMDFYHESTTFYLRNPNMVNYKTGQLIGVCLMFSSIPIHLMAHCGAGEP